LGRWLVVFDEIAPAFVRNPISFSTCRQGRSFRMRVFPIRDAVPAAVGIR
jgi:hypothetical protein